MSKETPKEDPVSERAGLTYPDRQGRKGNPEKELRNEDVELDLDGR